MNIRGELSSAMGERSEEANRNVAAQCLDDPSLLKDIVAGLSETDEKLTADCAEVMTMVGEERPEFVAPHAEKLVQLLSHSYKRARWETIHALSHVAALRPDVVTPQLSRIEQIIQTDDSKIARRYAIELLAAYARTGVKAAQESYPLLVAACDVLDGDLANVALNGLTVVAVLLPEKGDELATLAERFLNHSKGVVRKAAQILQNSVLPVKE